MPCFIYLPYQRVTIKKQMNKSSDTLGSTLLHSRVQNLIKSSFTPLSRFTCSRPREKIMHCCILVLVWSGLFTNEPRGVNMWSYKLTGKFLIGQFCQLPSCIISASSEPTWGSQIQVTDRSLCSTFIRLMCICVFFGVTKSSRRNNWRQDEKDASSTVMISYHLNIICAMIFIIIS